MEKTLVISGLLASAGGGTSMLRATEEVDDAPVDACGGRVVLGIPAPALGGKEAAHGGCGGSHAASGGLVQSAFVDPNDPVSIISQHLLSITFLLKLF